MKKSTWACGLALMLLMTAAATSVRAADQPAAENPEVSLIALNFGDSVDVRVLAKWISQVTGQNFAYDESFQGTVMLETPTDMPESALLPLFESILKLKGFAMVRQGDLIMIVKTVAAPALDTQLTLPSGEFNPDQRNFVTQVVAIKYASVTAVADAIKPFLSHPSAVQIISQQNELTLSDYPESVQRAMDMIAHLDEMAARARVVLMPLTFARAADVVTQLNLAFGKAGEGRGARAGLPVFNADQRTNSVVVIAAEDDLETVQVVVRTLDVKAVEPERPVRIYRLRNVKAKQLLPLLTAVIQDYGSATAAEGEVVAAPFGGGTTTGKSIKIVGDEDNNTLVVVATNDEQAWLAKLITDLDQRRPQVLIEAWLVDLNETGAEELGVELASHNASSYFGLTGVDETTGERTLLSPPNQGLTLAILRGADIRALLHALTTNEKGKVLSQPRLLANANEQATFSSVREVPYVSINAITSSTSTTAYGGSEKAGTELVITPTILEGDFVVLEISLSVSSFIGQATSIEVPPVRDENKIETTVTVPNLSTIVIGGIVRGEETETIRKVPILGDIPLLKFFFRSKSKSTVNTVIYAFIRPQIFRAEDFSDLKDMSEQDQQDLQRRQGSGEAAGEEGAHAGP